MKQTLKLALLCAFAVFAVHAKKDKDSVLDSINQKVSRINSQLVGQCSNEIYPSDIGPNGYIINSPGVYCLVGDVNWNAASSTSAVFTINASNVTLNLNGHYVVQTNAPTSAPTPDYTVIVPPSTFQTVGVLINKQHDVKVYNGTLENMAIGIEAAGTLGAGGLGSSNVVLTQLVLDNNASAGIYVQPGSSNFEVTDIIVNNAGFEPSISLVADAGSPARGGPYGLGIAFIGDITFNTGALYTINNPIQNVIIKDCFITGMGYAPSGFSFPEPLLVEGLRLTAVQQAEVSNVVVDQSQAIIYPGSFGRQACKNVNFRLCTGSNQQSQGLGKVYFDDTCDTCLTEDCVAYNYTSNLSQNAVSQVVAVAGGIPPAPANFVSEAEGWKLLFSQNMTYRNCIAAKARANSLTATTPQTTVGHCFGFTIVGGFNPGTGEIILEDCHVLDLETNSILTAEDCAGFNWGAAVAGNATQGLTILDCTANNITMINTGGVQLAGFVVNGTKGALLDHCVAENINSSITTVTAIGIDMACNNGIVQHCVVRNTNGVGYRAEAGAMGGLGEFNTFVEDEAAQNAIFGFQDVSGTKQNVFKRNEAFDNGPAGANTSNYSGLAAGTPIRVWVLGTPPAATDNNGILDPEFDNQSIGLS